MSPLDFRLDHGYHRKERSKRPRQCKCPGALKSQKHAKNGANAPGRLVFVFVFLTPRVRCKRPGASFFVLFREEGPVGRAHDTIRCLKRTCCRSGKGRFAACNGRNSAGVFFSLHIYSPIQVGFFKLLCLNQWTQHDQTNKANRCRGRKKLQKRR